MRCFIVLTALFLLLTASVSTGFAQGPASSMSLTWSPPAPQTPPVAVTGYRVYGSQTAGSYTYGATSPNLLASFTVPGTAAAPAIITVSADGVPRFFVVTAYNTVGESPPSNEVTGTPPDKRVPLPPGNVNIVLQFSLDAQGNMVLTRVLYVPAN